MMTFEEFLNEEKWLRDSDLTVVIRVFKKMGYELIRQTPHVIMKKNDKTLSIPNHKKLNSATLKQVLNTAGIDKNDFAEMYRKA